MMDVKPLVHVYEHDELEDIDHFQHEDRWGRPKYRRDLALLMVVAFLLENGPLLRPPKQAKATSDSGDHVEHGEHGEHQSPPVHHDRVHHEHHKKHEQTDKIDFIAKTIHQEFNLETPVPVWDDATPAYQPHKQALPDWSYVQQLLQPMDHDGMEFHAGTRTFEGELTFSSKDNANKLLVDVAEPYTMPLFELMKKLDVKEFAHAKYIPLWLCLKDFLEGPCEQALVAVEGDKTSKCCNTVFQTQVFRRLGKWFLSVIGVVTAAEHTRQLNMTLRSQKYFKKERNTHASTAVDQQLESREPKLKDSELEKGNASKRVFRKGPDLRPTWHTINIDRVKAEAERERRRQQREAELRRNIDKPLWTPRPRKPSFPDNWYETQYLRFATPSVEAAIQFNHKIASESDRASPPRSPTKAFSPRSASSRSVSPGARTRPAWVPACNRGHTEVTAGHSADIVWSPFSENLAERHARRAKIRMGERRELRTARSSRSPTPGGAHAWEPTPERSPSPEV